jgi:hypothetical protein
VLSLKATLPSATVLTIVYWSGFALFDPPEVSWVTRAAFYACCVAALLFVRPGGRSRAPAIGWTVRAAYCVLLAMLFYGTNQARDILYGPERLKPELPGWLGGLELWWILCPGLVSVCLAIAAARFTLDAPVPRAACPGDGGRF